MANLTKKEIVDQLNKLGIHTTSEIDLYYAEYKAYSAKSSHAYFIEHYKDSVGNSLYEEMQLL